MCQRFTILTRNVSKVHDLHEECVEGSRSSRGMCRRFTISQGMCRRFKIFMRNASKVHDLFTRNVPKVRVLHKECVEGSQSSRGMCRRFMIFTRNVSKVHDLQEECVEGSRSSQGMCRRIFFQSMSNFLNVFFVN